MTPVSHGKPCAGNPHARFEEGASAQAEPRRNALLHNRATTETNDDRTQTCPACKSCFDRIWGLFFMLMISLLACCANEDPQEARIRQAESNARTKISEIPDVLKRATGAYEFGETVSAAIEEVPDRERRYKLFKEAVDKVFETEIDPYIQYNSICVIDELLGPIGHGWFKSGRTVEELNKDRLRRFTWKKMQLNRLKMEFAKVRPKTFAKPISEAQFNRFVNLKGLIESLSGTIEDDIAYYERRLWKKRSKMSSEGWADVKRCFEEFSGHPIRTPEQIDEYFQKKLEARHLAEESSKTNRPPPLILIDATK